MTRLVRSEKVLVSMVQCIKNNSYLHDLRNMHDLHELYEVQDLYDLQKSHYTICTFHKLLISTDSKRLLFTGNTFYKDNLV